DAAHAAATGFPDEVSPYRRWGLRDAKAYLRAAPDLTLVEPHMRIISVQTLDDGARLIEGELQAGRNGFLYGITFASGAAVREFWANGERLAQSEAFDAPRELAVTFSGVGDRTMQFRLLTSSSAPVAATMFELSSPPEHPDLAAIIAERPDTAAPIHFGDHAEVQRQITF
ncbi:MAG TPA: hypothetical protein PLS69_03115, partial [Terricaulis sp.]|nr:hypothetical protein [Terricaulis sp.]